MGSCDNSTRKKKGGPRTKVMDSVGGHDIKSEEWKRLKDQGCIIIL
jgi:hypothetical protein